MIQRSKHLFWKAILAALAVAGVLRGKTQAHAQTLEIHYTKTDGKQYSRSVDKDAEYLDLNSREIASIVLPDGLTNLKELSLFGNQLTSIVLPDGLTNLEDLYLEHNYLTNFELPEGLANLEFLGLNDNQLTSFVLPDGLTELRILNLWINNLTNIVLPDGLTNLESLGLEVNQLTNIVLPSGLAHLDKIHVGGNSLERLLVPFDMENRASDIYIYYSLIDFVSLNTALREPSRFPFSVELYDPEERPIVLPPMPPTGAVLTVTRKDGGFVEVSWKGVLQKSASIEGPWIDVEASSPLSVIPGPSTPTEFFRVRPEDSSSENPGTDPSSDTFTLPLNSSLEGSIGEIGEVDVYEITVTGSGTLTVYSTGSMDLYGRLLDSSGNELASNDDGGEDTNFRISYSVSAGTYYVRVRHYRNSRTGNYGITSSFARPEPLPLNGSLEGSIDEVGEADVYEITVDGSGTLTVFSTGSMDLYGHLLDSSGNELASNDDGGEDTNFRISHLVSAGTYYVRVRHYDDSGTGNYGITSSFQ